MTIDIHEALHDIDPSRQNMFQHCSHRLLAADVPLKGATFDDIIADSLSRIEAQKRCLSYRIR
jgi:hypothetical protein